VFGIPEIIEYLSNIFTLNEGDLILTGTPQGASPVNSGDTLHGKMLENGKVLAELSAKIQSAL
jgi:2-keto-4-pentenoate hydratase/2-oxohepta-3-ene-1,7-dioic acid hydratase in catechol pathway